jgi:hypothetical protein
MKKIALLLSLAILLPALGFAYTETAINAESPINYESLKDYLNTRQVAHKRYANGLRSWEFVPYKYELNRLADRNIGVKAKPQFPGVDYKKLCIHWKNCIKRVYQASNGYDRAYKKYEPKRFSTFLNKAKTRGYKRGQRNITLEDSRSGNYKLWHWGTVAK